MQLPRYQRTEKATYLVRASERKRSYLRKHTRIRPRSKDRFRASVQRRRIDAKTTLPNTSVGQWKGISRFLLRRQVIDELTEPTGFEPAIFCVTGRHVRPLHHGSWVFRALQKLLHHSYGRTRIIPEYVCRVNPFRRLILLDWQNWPWMGPGCRIAPISLPPLYWK